MDLPAEVEVVVEVPRFGFVKRSARGAIDFVSPLPCPFNYGSIVGSTAPDGDPLDAIVLGRRLARGARVRVPVRAVFGFVDAGERDPKVVCSARPLSARDRRRVARFFALYTLAKRALHEVRRRPGATFCEGFVD